MSILFDNLEPGLTAEAASLELRDVGCARGGRLLFGGLSLRLEPGRWLRVAGENGAGKTSLLRLLAGLLPPAEGQVLWRGAPLVDQAERLGRERLYLGHAPALKEDLSPLENLQAACTLAGDPVTQAQAEVIVERLQASDAPMRAVQLRALGEREGPRGGAEHRQRGAGRHVGAPDPEHAAQRLRLAHQPPQARARVAQQLCFGGRAREILDNWSTYRTKFKKIMPIEYRRALHELMAENENRPMAVAGE